MKRRKRIEKYEQLVKVQEAFIEKLQKDYDTMSENYLKEVSEGIKVRDAVQEFIECCSDGMEIEHYKHKFKILNEKELLHCTN